MTIGTWTLRASRGGEVAEEVMDVNVLLLKLSPMQARILRWRFGIHEGPYENENLTLKEIGDKYNLSKERIRVMQEQALDALRSLYGAPSKIRDQPQVCREELGSPEPQPLGDDLVLPADPCMTVVHVAGRGWLSSVRGNHCAFSPTRAHALTFSREGAELVATLAAGAPWSVDGADSVAGHEQSPW